MIALRFFGDADPLPPCRFAWLKSGHGWIEAEMPDQIHVPGRGQPIYLPQYYPTQSATFQLPAPLYSILLIDKGRPGILFSTMRTRLCGRSELLP